MNITFQEPSVEYKDELMKLCSEYQAKNVYLHGACGLTEHDNFESWLDRVQRLAAGKDIRASDVKTFTYLVLEDNSIVGFVNIRPLLNRKYLRRGGNIMFSVVKESQHNGYATAILTKAIEICKSWGMSKIRLTCHTDNLAATRVITKCGGVLDSVEYCCEDGAEISKFWITID